MLPSCETLPLPAASGPPEGPAVELVGACPENWSGGRSGRLRIPRKDPGGGQRTQVPRHLGKGGRGIHSVFQEDPHSLLVFRGPWREQGRMAGAVCRAEQPGLRPVLAGGSLQAQGPRP